MTVQLKTIATLAVLGLTLPGCSALFGTNKLANQTGSQGQIQASTAKAAAAAPTELTNAGRRALDQGNAGIAIDTFSRALASGEAPAPALNGLGVAFARIGRFDLAQRYFEKAAQIDPIEPRYQTNLARLMRSPLFATRHEGDATRALVAEAEQQQATEAKTRQADASGQLRRVGANQFFIQTAAPVQSKGPVRTAMVIARNKLHPAIDIRSVEETFDATIGKGAKAAKPAAPVVDDKPTPRTVKFNQIRAARP
ncbi:MAG: tetratricopeptide repeat protein [Sphingomonadales bacterium]|nr:tetratricopeptide repeat protein [Sphingomonadales bacterium]